MTVATTTAQNIKNGNGSTTLFPLDFIFFVAADLKVTHILADGTLVPKTLTTDFTVAGGEGTTGSITTIFVAATGTQVVIERVLPFSQNTDFTQNDIFPAEANEQGLDRLVLLAQQVLLRAQRSVTLPLNTTGLDTGDVYVMPLPEDDKLLVGDAAAKKWTNKTLADISPVAVVLPFSIAQGGTGSTTAAAARTALGLGTAAELALTQAELDSLQVSEVLAQWNLAT